VKPDGGKVARAYAVQPVVEARQCYLPHPSIAPWVEDFIRQLAQFPRGRNDDDVDACTQALNVLARSERDEPQAEEETHEITPAMRAAEAERQQRIAWRRERRQHPNHRPIDPNFGSY
jgi:hypothetical protein